MPTFLLDSTGADVDWRVKESAPWRTDCQLLDGNTPIDISTATIEAIISERSTPSPGDPLKTFTVTVLDAAAGEWMVEVATPDADLDVGRYWWAMSIDFGDGAEPLCEGQFIVEPWVLP